MYLQRLVKELHTLNMSVKHYKSNKIKGNGIRCIFFLPTTRGGTEILSLQVAGSQSKHKDGRIYTIISFILNHSISPKILFPSLVLQTKSLHEFPASPTRVECPINITLSDLVIVIIIGG